MATDIHPKWPPGLRIKVPADYSRISDGTIWRTVNVDAVMDIVELRRGDNEGWSGSGESFCRTFETNIELPF